MLTVARVLAVGQATQTQRAFKNFFQRKRDIPHRDVALFLLVKRKGETKKGETSSPSGFTFCFRLVLLFLLFAFVVEIEVNSSYNGDASTIRAIIIAPTIILFFTFCLRLVLLFLLLALIVEIEVNIR